MPTRNVNVTEHFDEFIRNGVVSGRFSDTSEMVAEGLRLLEQREKEDKVKLQWPRGATEEGFDASERGDHYEINSEEEMNSFFDQIRRQDSAELAAERELEGISR